MRPSDIFSQKSSQENSQLIAETKTRMALIQTIRIGVLILFLLLTFILQWIQPEFINSEVWIPTYILMSVAFLGNALLIYYFDKVAYSWKINALAFGYDAVLITSLIYLTGGNQSLFLFLYLVNIILCGLAYQRRGGLALALWTSILFTLLLIFTEDLVFKNYYLILSLNNFAFFLVAFLSGLLSEQINFMGVELEAKGEEIVQLRDFNKLVVENIQSGLMTIDTEYNVNFINKTTEKILDDVLLLNKPIKEVFSGFDLSWLDSKKQVIRKSITYKNFKGEKQLLELVISPLLDRKTNIGFVLLIQDLTEVKKLEEQMRQQEKLAAVGQLAAGIAHEIRNPLASISGSIQMMEASSETSDENKKLMNIIYREIERLNNLITEFLEFVRPDEVKEDPIDVNKLLSDILEMIRFNDKLNHNVEQETQLEAKQIILGNYDKLKQAFLNIIINAYQAMESSESPKLTVSTYDNNTDVIVLIEDKGPGMDANQVRRIFEPFHTTKAKGTGLGLAVTHKIFESHKAEVIVESEVGVGTTFKIIFHEGRGRPQVSQLAV
ncbi:MAG: ATP-binding protein [Bdellovibrionales bacterium]|nr:ATP-binding protein [Bdellovibrionales bacterium]